MDHVIAITPPGSRRANKTGGLMPFYSKLKHHRNDEADQASRTTQRLIALRKALAKHLADRQIKKIDRGRSVRIGTWNIREFGGGKHGGRTFESLYYIAEIISNFDIVALQEVRGDLEEFAVLLKILGPDWDYLATDVTDGSAGNGERMVFLFNQRKAFFRGVAGELTLPTSHKILASFGERLRLGNGGTLVLPEQEDLSGDYKAKTRKAKTKYKLDSDLEIPLPPGCSLELPDGCSLTLTKNAVIKRPRRGVARIKVPHPGVRAGQYRLRFPGGALDDSFKQFARTPYIVAFQSGWLKINLCTVHIYFGDNDDPKLLAQRRDEIRALTKSLGDRARDEYEGADDDNTMLGLLGDFNIISKEHETMQALESNGFVVPEALKKIPGSNVAKDKAYDQIAFWKPQAVRRYAKLDVVGAGVFDFFKHVYRLEDKHLYKPLMGDTRDTYKTWRTYKMSDHLFMWVELRNDFGDEYLKDCQDCQED